MNKKEYLAIWQDGTRTTHELTERQKNAFEELYKNGLNAILIIIKLEG